MNTTIELSLEGMHCASCTSRVERILNARRGITGAKANLLTHRVRLDLGPDADLAGAADALGKAGFTPQLQTTALAIEGMHCASCTGRVERALLARPGVTAASVNLLTQSADVTHAPTISPGDLAQIVTKAGYPASPREAAQPQPGPQSDDSTALRRQVILAGLLTLPVFIAEMGGHVIPGFHHWLHTQISHQTLLLAQFVLTALVLAFPGRVFFARGVPALLRGAPEMNSLVALGAGAAFLYSTVTTFAPGLLPEAARHVYFESAAVIVTLILFGRWLEARAKGQAGDAIRRLMDLTPATARVERGGAVLDIPAADLSAGDIVQLRPGERASADGEIVSGRGHVDESMLTGEPLPAPKAPGDAITGGTVNGDTALRFRVTQSGAQTRLAAIVRLVEAAQAGKLPVQAMVDRITRVFVPVVIALSVLSFALWMIFAPAPALPSALVAAISVLIIACPCAMGLAVPVSILVGTGRGAQLGILFRQGEALQRLAEAQIVAFDKTGTLTRGRPVIGGIHAAEGQDENEALRLAAAAEAGSEHPLSRAFAAEAKARGLSLPEASDTRAIVGRGLSARIGDAALLIGNEAALREADIAPDAALLEAASMAARQGATMVHLAIDQTHAASFEITDQLRDGAREAVAELHDLGLRTALLSGDSEAAARAVGASLDIAETRGGMTPETKLAHLRGMGGGSVFVGDGINDAPALAGAETGIAMGGGTDIAIESAQVALMRPDPRAVAVAVRLSRAVMRNIRQNLFWAFAYNTALIPVAMGVLVPFGGPKLSPMLAAFAMAMSSVFVVTNALRLRRFS
ncbi:MAG: heavy metal translocating P-type ATPase [Paracoccus sp. (in: a-proteobacteria)]|nr:heavy metal translocating P-type ATPase [Paracoccus sp. (in: a-proteobacteria)]